MYFTIFIYLNDNNAKKQPISGIYVPLADDIQCTNTIILNYRLKTPKTEFCFSIFASNFNFIFYFITD